MTAIESFLQSEESKMNWFDKVFGNYPVLNPTRSLAYNHKRSNLPYEKKIGPSILVRIVGLVILSFLSILWFGLLNMVLLFRFPFAVLLFGFFLVSLMIFLIVRNFFFVKKYNYVITISQVAISIDQHHINWTEIDNTYLMHRQEGRRTNYYLVIAKKDNTVEVCDLFNFGISARKLATFIEYYKPKGN